jgi:hypothetical protein
MKNLKFPILKGEGKRGHLQLTTYNLKFPIFRGVDNRFTKIILCLTRGGAVR